MKKYLPILLLAIAAVILFSFRKQEVFVEVSGKVLHQGQGLQSVCITVVKGNNDGDCAEGTPTLYFEHSKANGSFHLRFNVLEGRPTYLHFEKPGYSLYREPVIASRQGAKINLEKRDLIDLSEAANFTARQASQQRALPISNRRTVLASAITLYADDSFSSAAETIDPGQIRYFDKIERKKPAVFHLVEDGENQQLKGYWHEVSFSSRDGQPYKGWIFQ